MCWIGYGEEQHSLIAEEDIPCFKILEYVKNIGLVSYYYEFHYNLNELYKCDFSCKYDFEYGLFRINKGFHSYSVDCVIDCLDEDYFRIFSKSNDSLLLDLYHNDDCNYRDIYIASCIIPKGSIYNINEDGEIVSNQIIIKGRYAN